MLIHFGDECVKNLAVATKRLNVELVRNRGKSFAKKIPITFREPNRVVTDLERIIKK